MRLTWTPTCPPITAEALPAVLREAKAVVLQFWASWDNNGRLLEACLQLVRPSMGQGLAFYSVDVDTEGLTDNFGILTTPTLVFLLNGSEADRRIGLGPLSELALRLQKWREAAEPGGKPTG